MMEINIRIWHFHCPQSGEKSRDSAYFSVITLLNWSYVAIYIILIVLFRIKSDTSNFIEVFGEQRFPQCWQYTANWWQSFNFMTSLIRNLYHDVNLYHDASLMTWEFLKMCLRQKRVTFTFIFRHPSNCKLNFLGGKSVEPELIMAYWI